MKTEETIVKSFETLGREFYGPDFSGDKVVEDLSKAMVTGTNVAGVAAQPLMLENLDSTMTNVLFTQEHLKIWKALPRVPSAQPLYQWLRRDSYGSSRGQAGFREGGTPKGGVSKWTRNSIMNKYLGVRGGYTHQMLVTGTMGGSFVEPVAEENRNRTLELMEKIERNVVFGDKLILDEAAAEVNYDGFIKQLAGSSSVLDKQGNPLDFEDFENLGERLKTTGKLGSFSNIQTFFTPRVLSDLAKLKLQAERKELTGATPAGYRPGTPIEGYKSQHGYFPFDDSIFLEAVPDNKPLAVADVGAPAAPAGCSVAVAADVTSLLEAGTDYYGVSSINDSGESVLFMTTSVATTAGNKNTLTITRMDVGNCTGYRVYRGKAADGSDALWIASVPQSASGAIVFVDRNGWRPGGGVALVMNMSEPDITVAQMAPLLKFPLAVTNTTIEFLLLLYHVLVVKASERMYLIKNIGKRA